MTWCVRAVVVSNLVGARPVYTTRKILDGFTDQQQATRYATEAAVRPVVWENERGIVYAAMPLYLWVEEER